MWNTRGLETDIQDNQEVWVSEGAVCTDAQDKLEEGPREDTSCHFYSNT